MHKTIITNVCLSSCVKYVGGGRMGTLYTNIDNLAKKIGNPHAVDFSEDGLDGAGKVHANWYLDTPRGPVEIGDYWWNPENVLSIRCGNKKAVLWAVSWLKCIGLKASSHLN